jgi:murein DD-endopeptidase MepM/ murein hydrolase activator NlpD
LPRKGRKRPDSFSLIIVPHTTDSQSFSLRIPFWTIYVSIGLVIIGLAGLAFLLLDYQDASAQLAQLRRGGQIETVRQSDLRNIIAAERSQQETLRAVISAQSARAAEQANEWADDATRFNDEVSRLYAQIAELERFKAEIRRMVGLDKTSSPATPADQAARTQGTSAIGPLEPLPEDRVALSTSSRGSGRLTTVEDAIAVAAELLDNAVPQQLADLEALKQEVSDRLAKVEGRWTSPEQLSMELNLYDASPRAWPVSGLIMARYGYDTRRLELGAQPFHKGIDIGGPVGTPVRAPQDGVVSNAGWNGSYGLMLEIRHSLGWSTLYAHLSSVPVKVGEQVKKGQVIAYIGMTGLTTGPHLHYEIHLNGTPVDPSKYVGR